MPNLVAMGSREASPQVGEIYTSFSDSDGSFVFLLPCFFEQVTDHNLQRIFMYYGSKDLVWRKDVPFEYPKC